MRPHMRLNNREREREREGECVRVAVGRLREKLAEGDSLRRL